MMADGCRIPVGWALAHSVFACHHGVGQGPPYESDTT